MSLTIISASYANEDHTAAVIVTEEIGAVAVSEADRPDEWASMLKWGEPNPYQPPAESPDLRDEWSGATTQAAKLAVLAKAMGLTD